MDYDFIIIGGGSAGYAAARTASALGLKTLVAEGGIEVGGLCILRGCMPSKALLASANRARQAREADALGVRVRGTEPDLPAIIRRKRRLIGEFADYRRQQLERGTFDFVRGQARFLDPHTVEITALEEGGTRKISAHCFLVATGSTHHEADIPGLREAGFLTSDDMLDAESLPASLAVLGGGPVALEMACYAAFLGSDVTVIQRSPHVLRDADEEIALALQHALQDRGLRVCAGTHLERVIPGAAGHRVEFRHGDRLESVEAAAILQAMGRRPATQGLALDRAGVDLEAGRVVIAATQETSQPHIFAAGDVCGPHEIVHVAIAQGEIAARNAARVLGRLHGHPEHRDDRLLLFAVFTEPQLAVAGLTEKQAAAMGIECVAASYPFAEHGKSLVLGEPHGLVKLIARPENGELIGGAVVGAEASELIHEIVVAMRFHATAADLAAIPHYHPTLSEIWTYPAEELAEKTRGG